MGVRLADLLGGLSRLADLGFGLVPGEAVRSCVVATTMAETLGLSTEDRRATFHTALLHHVGCTGFAHETAALFDDELAVNAASARMDLGDPRDVGRVFLPAVTRGRPLGRKVANLGRALGPRGAAFGRDFTTAACEVAADAARRLGQDQLTQRSLRHVYEHWEGTGHPSGLAGEDIPLPARLARVSGIAVLFDTLDGRRAAAEAVARRAGGMLDPELAARLVADGDDLLGALEAADPLETMLALEPAPVAEVLDPQLVDVARVFGDLADLKSPFLHGHSRRTAALARGAGEELGVGGLELVDLEVAGLLHDVGRVAISSRIWDASRDLTRAEREEVRLHAYHAERIVSGSERLAAVAPLVGRHHERLDGSGYHRQVGGDGLSAAARVLAAADVYAAATADRPHRPALGDMEARSLLEREASAGRLDPTAVAAVLTAAGHDAPAVVPDPPAGLTTREVEVLGLVSRGLSNRAVAERLHISRRTAEHHIQSVYRKVGVSSRAAVALFAMEHGLVPPGG